MLRSMGGGTVLGQRQSRWAGWWWQLWGQCVGTEASAGGGSCGLTGKRAGWPRVENSVEAGEGTQWGTAGAARSRGGVRRGERFKIGLDRVWTSGAVPRGWSPDPTFRVMGRWRGL